ncbi:MAG: helix-turn-helix transcriptional regulator [Gammaproteobacteria bacterium]|nr:helix-turn-helix transcriptional regulator [Gammaproteobacteria bacterium]
MEGISMNLRKHNDSLSISNDSSSNLTDREIEILRWLMEGKSSWDVGKILSISERTVKYHVNNICVKLNAVNRTHAVAKAILNNII